MSLIVLIVLLAVIYGISKRKPKTSNTDNSVESLNQGWARFIFGYRKLAKNKSQKDIIDRMLTDLTAQGIQLPSDLDTTEYSEPVPDDNGNSIENQSEQTYASTAANVEVENQSDQVIQKSQIQLDNASLLLYFVLFFS